MTHHYDINALKTFWYLLLRSWIISRSGLLDKFINQSYWLIMNILIFTYVMPSMGLEKSYGAFMAITIPVTTAFFVSIHCIYSLLSDITSDGSNLRYELTLPIHQSWIFIKHALENAFQSFIIACVQLPIGYFLIGGSINLSILAVIKFYSVLLLTSIFSGFFSLFIVSMATNLSSGLDNVWMRIILPVWLFGCYNYPWQTSYNIAPWFGYISLLNPLTSASEGARSSLAFESSSLNYWYCVCSLIGFTALFGYIGIKRLMKRMDCL